MRPASAGLAGVGLYEGVGRTGLCWRGAGTFGVLAPWIVPVFVEQLVPCFGDSEVANTGKDSVTSSRSAKLAPYPKLASPRP